MNTMNRMYEMDTGASRTPAKRKKHPLLRTVIIITLLIFSITAAIKIYQASRQTYLPSAQAYIPSSLQNLYDTNSDARQFVLDYEENKDKTFEIDLSEYSGCTQVPLLMQWDERWGYKSYSGGMIGLTGCGPTCLSMAAIYLTGDTSMDPLWMAEFSTSNGYSTLGNGSSWTLFSEGAVKLGLDVTEIPLDKARIDANLEVGNPVVCIMGPGDFTTSGHYIILTGIVDGEYSLNDPNSYANSEKTWSYDDISDQIRNLWALRY